MIDLDSIYARVNREFACDHDETQLTRFVASNGAVHYRTQCLECGDNLKTHKKGDILHLLARGGEPPEFDREIGQARSRRWSERYQQLRAEAEEQENANWHDWYQDYLRSPGWRQRRDLVMGRAGGICEGCLTRPASQVHHLTYDHVGDELLFELRAVCRECHEKIHADNVDVRRN